jgi:hypothetical protein
MHHVVVAIAAETLSAEAAPMAPAMAAMPPGEMMMTALPAGAVFEVAV